MPIVNADTGNNIYWNSHCENTWFDTKIIDASVEGISIGITYMYKDGKLELKHGYGWWGWSVSIDFVEFFKWVFGGR